MGSISRGVSPEEFKSRKFVEFYSILTKKFAKGNRFSVKDAVKASGYNEDTVRRYLNYMNRWDLASTFDIKRAWGGPPALYYFGCTPSEEILASAREFETAIAAQAFHLLDRLAGTLRPARIASANLSLDEKMQLLGDWYGRDKYWQETHLLLGLLGPLAVGGIILANEIAIRFESNSKEFSSQSTTG